MCVKVDIFYDRYSMDILPSTPCIIFRSKKPDGEILNRGARA